MKRYWVDIPNLTNSTMELYQPVEMVKYDDIKDSLIVWHKVEDELPDEKYDGEIVVKWKLSPECGWHYDITGSGYIRAHPTVITYWAYLPKPPKE